MFTFIFQFLSNHFLFFALHFENRNVFPKPLSAKQEHECFVRMAEGDSSARDTLIEHNLRLVAHIIKKYYLGIQDQEDLISIGTIGLIKAVSTFDYTKGCRFATYGSRCVENAILTQRLYLRRMLQINSNFRTNGGCWSKSIIDYFFLLKKDKLINYILCTFIDLSKNYWR